MSKRQVTAYHIEAKPGIYILVSDLVALLDNWAASAPDAKTRKVLSGVADELADLVPKESKWSSCCSSIDQREAK